MNKFASADVPLGLPINIASYAALQILVAKKMGFSVGDFIWTGGDVHVYSNQIDILTEQIKRDSKPLPRLCVFNVGNDESWDGIREVDFMLVGYDPHPAVKYPDAAV